MVNPLHGLSQESIKMIEQQMRPGWSSEVGFLAPNDSLQEIIQRDLQVLEENNITGKQIGDRIETILGKARRHATLFYTGRSKLTREHIEGFTFNRGIGIPVENRYLLKATHCRGLQNCPFGTSKNECEDEHRYGFMDCSLTNMKTGEEIDFPGLLVHLAREHSFFEGNTKYRVDPQKLIDVLELQSNVDYSPTYVEERGWFSHFSTGSTDISKLMDFYKDLIDSPEEVMKVKPGLTIYLKNRNNRLEGLLFCEEEIQFEEALLIHGTPLIERHLHPGMRGIHVDSHTYVPIS